MRLRRRLQARQHGAVMVTVAFALLFLLGFMGVALDFGHLFVVKPAHAPFHEVRKHFRQARLAVCRFSHVLSIPC